MAKFEITRGKSIPAVVDVNLAVLDKNEPDFEDYFRPLVGHLIGLLNPVRQDPLTLVGTVARRVPR